jgi:hypothetical protein
MGFVPRGVEEKGDGENIAERRGEPNRLNGQRRLLRRATVAATQSQVGWTKKNRATRARFFKIWSG